MIIESFQEFLAESNSPDDRKRYNKFKRHANRQTKQAKSASAFAHTTGWRVDHYSAHLTHANAQAAHENAAMYSNHDNDEYHHNDMAAYHETRSKEHLLKAKGK